MRRGRVEVSPELLVELLGIKDGSSVYGADWDFSKDCLVLYFEGGSLPEVAFRETVPCVQLEATRIESKWRV